MRFAAALLFAICFAPFAAAQVPFVKELPQPKSDWDTGYFKNASVGDYASYLDHRGNLFRRPEVTGIGDRQVTVSITGNSGGRASQSIQILKFDGPEWPKNSLGNPKTSRAKFKVGERELDCELTEYYRDGKLVHRIWKSAQVPFDGRVKHEAFRVGPDGKEEFTGGETLIEFKFAKAPK